MTDQDGTPEEEGQVDTAIVTVCLGRGSYASACASFSHLYTKCGLNKEFCNNSQYLWKNLSLYNMGAEQVHGGITL